MKIIRGSRKNAYLTRANLFFIMVVLLAGVVGCQGNEGESYTLTIASTTGGSVTTPGEGTFTCNQGAVIALAVEADQGYQFINWTGNTSAIADTTAATTNITMDGDYSITAKFVAIYDITISSTEGGSVITPGEGTYAYYPDTEVDLMATSIAGYGFIEWIGDVSDIGSVNHPTTSITMTGDCSITATFAQYTFPQYTFVISTGFFHTVGCRSDGSAVAVGKNDWGRCNVGSWHNIVEVAAGSYHTVGLKADGTVVAVGSNINGGQCNVGTWTDIVQVAAGHTHTVGLRSDGTVVAVGNNGSGRCDVDNWTDIVQIAAGASHTVGLKSDGTVVAVGADGHLQCHVTEWTNITQVSAGCYAYYTVGLKSDGTVVAVGDGPWGGELTFAGWTGIAQVSSNELHMVGLQSNGAVVAIGSNDYGQCDVDDWTDIIQVAAGGGEYSKDAEGFTVGLKSDGTVVAVGCNSDGQCNVESWTLF